ncbi:hypothetical protein AB0C04_03550 [Micromonospora sp. NPDC048909]|uniref:hypothetical protein n=1 Tax=Micromonospora sp. NPDC048909 TaxID=3155643 RepID=UPI0033F31E49
MTRFAVAALALTVGFGGATTVPALAAPPVAQVRSSAVSSQVEALRPEAAPSVERLVDITAPSPRPTGQPIVTAPTGIVPSTFAPAVATDAGRGAPGRRGPPRA